MRGDDPADSRASAWRAAARDEGPARVIADLITLAENDEACRVLGVDGALDSQVDAAFLADPLDWIAFDIATALREAEADQASDSGITLTILVAELRLYRALRGAIDELALERAVRQHSGAERSG